MNLEGKNYTLKCKPQKKATKRLVGGGGSRCRQGVSHYSMPGHPKQLCRHSHILSQCAWMKTRFWVLQLFNN